MTVSKRIFLLCLCFLFWQHCEVRGFKIPSLRPLLSHSNGIKQYEEPTKQIRNVNLRRCSGIRSPFKSSIVSMSNHFNFQLRSEWWIWSALATSSSIGILLEKTKFGAALSANLITMAMTLILCNMGVMPISSNVYNTVMKYFVPLAIPLLLLDADLKKCMKTTNSLMKAFLVGSVGTLLGTIVAYMLVPMKSIIGSHKIAAALCARHIGGAVNFVAVSDILRTRPDAVAAALAADNVVVALYFAYLFLITKPAEEPLQFTTPKLKTSLGNYGPLNINIEASLASDSDQITNETRENSINVRTLSASLSLGMILCACSESLGRMLSISPMLLVSGTAVIAATMFPKYIAKVSPAGGAIGILLMQMFFAVTGAMGHIPTVMKMAPSLFLHTIIQITVHFLFAVNVGKYFRLPFREICLASNANVGGPTTAAGMASAKKWKELVLPALLTGIFGYAIATILGVGIAKLLVLLPTL